MASNRWGDRPRVEMDYPLGKVIKSIPEENISALCLSPNLLPLDLV